MLQHCACWCYYTVPARTTNDNESFRDSFCSCRGGRERQAHQIRQLSSTTRSGNIRSHGSQIDAISKSTGQPDGRCIDWFEISPRLRFHCNAAVRTWTNTAVEHRWYNIVVLGTYLSSVAITRQARTTMMKSACDISFRDSIASSVVINYMYAFHS